ncbi:MAG: nitroreductase family protein [Thermoplasmatota archaeon]
MSLAISEIIKKRRSIRRYKQKQIPEDLLEQMIEAARRAPSAANLQPLEYILINKKELCQNIFPHISWAGYLQPSWQPATDEQPTAYIAIIVNEENPYYQRDVGLSSAHIVLTAEAEDIGSCILCSIDKKQIKKILHIPPTKTLDSLIALGYKKEHPIMENRSDTIKYYLDKENILHVPKKPLAQVMHKNIYNHHK